MSEKIFKKLLKDLDDLKLKDFEKDINNLFKIKDNQSNPILLNLYGLFFEIKKDINKAINLFSRSIKFNNKYAPPYYNLGRIYFDNKMFHETIKFLTLHIEIDKQVFNSFDILAKAYFACYNYKDSIKILDKCLNECTEKLTENQRSYLYNFIGSNYSLLNETEKSLYFYKLALEKNKQDIRILRNIGNALRSIGKIEEANCYFLDCLKLNKEDVATHKDISVIKKYIDFKDPQLLKMIKIFNNKNISDNDKSTIGFAIAKAYDDLKDAKNTSQYLVVANKLRRENFQYNSSNQVEELNFNKKIFSNHGEFIINKDEKKIVPIFIVGMPRSGTTLVEQILSSHSEVAAGDEISYLADTIKEEVPHNNFEEFDILYSERPAYYLKKINIKYLQKLKSISYGKKFITDKMPLNFKLIGLIKNALPQSKIIHCVRDGRDTCLSIFKNSFANNVMPWSYDQKELVEFFNIYTDYMYFWKKNYNEYIFDLHYLDLINNHDKTIKNVLKFCNLSFEEKCLKFYDNKRSVNTVSTIQVRQPIYKSSVNAWQKFKDHLPDLFSGIKNYNYN